MQSALVLAAGRPLPPLSRLAFTVALTLFAWENRRTTRKALTRLDPHLLRDIGLDPGAAESEAQKPFWRA